MLNNGCKKFIRIGLTTVYGLIFISIQAQTLASENQYTNEPNNLKAFSTALGLRSLTDYSPIVNSIGFRINRNLGFVSSYEELTSSKSASKSGDLSSDDASTRINSRFAIDLFKSFFGGKKVYSRVGVYLWDVNINLNYSTAKLDINHAGVSQLIGIGTGFKWKKLQTNIDLEHYSAANSVESSDTRLLLNLSSRF